ncbi:hypothetical protein E4T47_02311 [Aureobasidium subglaciale]|nr:hypothetical protein E4T43_00132 [Aureobasidium subglaciale]KAI5274795.1 hypothetical protein E4T47_02311 [Aureobasidium subglaciale]
MLSHEEVFRLHYYKTRRGINPSRDPIVRQAYYHRTLIPHFEPRYIFPPMMDSGRSKRTRASISYVEPTELDDDIADEEEAIAEPEDSSPFASAPASADELSGSDDSCSGESDSDSDEWTDDKSLPQRTLKAQFKAQQKKKLAKKAKVQAERAQKIKDMPFRFMDLPPEIRVMIYKEALVESARDLSFVSKPNRRDFYRGEMKKKHYRYYGKDWAVRRDTNSDRDRTSLQPTILGVSKAFRDEAIPHFYGQTFHFGHPSTLSLFLATVSPANRMLLKHIVVNGWSYNNKVWHSSIYSAFTLLTAATNIKSIRMERPVFDDTDDGTNRHHARYYGNFWKDIENWAYAVDGIHGKGTARSVLKFSDTCFGSKDQVKTQHVTYIKRKQEFMASLKFSDKPGDDAIKGEVKEEAKAEETAS